ncbi:hypothetical protein AJ80_08146 [Polytolypa hystricis UAMH7299]|uniref:Uncharacterized protein n=1 Tax=Polytolypa hystricis (strain UAMH7299) TaxID=1447883 RepID=A0A2B7XD51_POLH7|nr:hypothetical protein AJ80_08146 [Polytolypa hystricis UAMH7299]
MANENLPDREPSPWLMTFEDTVTHRLRSPPIDRVSSAAGNIPDLMTSPHLPTEDSRTVQSLIDANFFAIAARAYQEAVIIPETPPPAGWVPGDPLHSYYELILLQFGECFRAILERRGEFHSQSFENEWTMHCRSILDTIRAEWSMHPFGSMGAIRTSANTENRAVAMLALQQAIAKPDTPPPAGWRVGMPMHPYYKIMLCRFEVHLKELLERYNSPMLEYPAEGRRAIEEFEGLIIREYRDTWITIFGLRGN